MISVAPHQFTRRKTDRSPTQPRDSEIGQPIEAPESPARRLGILYIASLSAIALIWVLGQWFIVCELQAVSGGVRGLVQADRDQSFARSIGQSALLLAAAEEGAKRDAALHVLRDQTARLERAPVPDAAPALRETLRRGREETLTHAQAMLARCDVMSASSTELRDLAEALVTADSTFQRALEEELSRAENESMVRLVHLRLLESLLCLYVIVVLILEGRFVVVPAIRDIQRHNAEMARSNSVLRGYAARLEQSNKELQEFASVASHDLQEPLRKVQAFADRLKRKYAGSLEEQGLDHLGRIQNAAERMQTLINDLLTYSRVTTKAQPFSRVDLAKCVRDVVADLDARVESSAGRVEIGALPTIDADPLQMRQLFQNLVGNALKYHRPDVPPVVKVTFRAGGGLPREDGREYVDVLVEDNGIGFEDQYRERIFQMFQRLHGRDEYEGTGVGLAVCRKIVERHSGSITARGVVGQGATFIVSLPVQQPRELSTDA